MKWLRNLLKGLSLTTALFVFQACYGTPAAIQEDYLLENESEQVPAPEDAGTDLAGETGEIVGEE